MVDARDKALEMAISALDKRLGKGVVMRLGDKTAEAVEVIPTGSRLLDEALGVGGYPRGRIIEVFGPESSGKTTLTLHAIAECQRLGGTAAFVDAEHALDVTYARKLGVDVDNLLVSQPDCGEAALDVTEALIRSGAVDLVVIDSVAALTPRAELEGEMGDHHVGSHARLMSQALRKITAAAAKSRTVVFFINQIRQKIGVTFGNPETTTGGLALKFFASMRLDIRRIGAVKAGSGENAEAIGNKTKIKIAKNKLAPPFRTVEFEIIYGRGVCPAGELLDRAEAAGMLQRNGSWFSIGSERLGQGREAVRDLLLTDPALFERVSNQVHAGPVPEAK